MMPSLVTWLTRKTVRPLDLAISRSRAAHSRTWVIEPASEVSPARDMVWIESMITSSGSSNSVWARMDSRSVSVSR
jgi:hypothetical protein